MYENLTIDDAAELLARRKVASAQLGGLVKDATTQAPSFGEAVMTDSPVWGTLRNAGIGAGLGGAAGAIYGALDPDEGQDRLTSALQNAGKVGLLGATAGGGATAIAHGLASMGDPAPGQSFAEPSIGSKAVGGGVLGYLGGRGIRGLASKLWPRTAAEIAELKGAGLTARRAGIMGLSRGKHIPLLARNAPWIGTLLGALAGGNSDLNAAANVKKIFEDE